MTASRISSVVILLFCGTWIGWFVNGRAVSSITDDTESVIFNKENHYKAKLPNRIDVLEKSRYMPNALPTHLGHEKLNNSNNKAKSSIKNEHLDRIYTGNMKIKSIFSSDDRYEIKNTDVLPYSAIAYISSGCTGTFIGPTHVLTAAHCVYDNQNRKWKENLEIWRKKSCDANHPGTKHTFKTAMISDVYRNLKLDEYDFAVIVVEGNSDSYLEIGWSDPMPNMAVSVKGYPDDKPDICLWGSWCTLSWQSRYILGHSCDTAHGMDGSAVYTWNWKTQRHVIYCVHIGDGDSSDNLNRCVRITEDRFALIQNWMNA